MSDNFFIQSSINQAFLDWNDEDDTTGNVVVDVYVRDLLKSITYSLFDLIGFQCNALSRTKCRPSCTNHEY